jgi:hypothetical protein
MPCMCGDTRCRSCGPAQGNSYCEQCGRWEEDGGCVDPEKCAQDAKKQEEALAEMFAYEDEHAEEIAKAIRRTD